MGNVEGFETLEEKVRQCCNCVQPNLETYRTPENDNNNQRTRKRMNIKWNWGVGGEQNSLR